MVLGANMIRVKLKNKLINKDVITGVPFFIPTGQKATPTPEIKEQMCFFLERLMPVKDACALIGLHDKTHYRWMKIGKDFIESYETDNTENTKARPPPSKKKYADYFLSVNHAIALMKRSLIERSLLPEKLHPGWIRDMTILERRDRVEWGRQLDIAIERKEDYDPDEAFL